MTGSTDLEPAETESWTPQHWSRQEWFYMWTRGLDIWRIAVLCRVPYRKVYEHVRNRIAYHPELFGARLMVHDQPALPPGGLKKPKPSWEERAAELVEFRRVQGRFPRGYIEGESSLYSFLQSQRGRYRAGKLPEPRKRHLDESVSGWLTPPKKERENALWRLRASELEHFVREQQRFPKYKTATEPLERILAVWMDRQRYCLRRGSLESSRKIWLDGRVPDWR